MADPDSKRPQERDFTIDQWDKFPFKKKDDPYENRPAEEPAKETDSQYKYEGWEHNAFPNKEVAEEPAEPQGHPHPSQSHPPESPKK